MNNVYISSKQKDRILQILQGHYDILVFGSRVTGKHLTFSDLDICLKAKSPIDLKHLAILREKLEESDLPFIVDLMDYHSVSKDFQQLIDKTAIAFEQADTIE